MSGLYSNIHCETKLVKSMVFYTVKYIADRTFYMTVFSTEKDLSFLDGCTAKIKWKLSVLRAYLLENYRDKFVFIISIS